jgi:hypothetical protein
LSRLSYPFPKAEEFEDLLSNCDQRCRAILAGLWLTEGAPFAFRKCPARYEEIRGWLGTQFQVNSKQITLIGSARIGFSLAPSPKFGTAFGEHSDLDIALVSKSLYGRVASAYELFSLDYQNGTVVPNTDRERALWEDNIEFGKRNIPRGFFDVNKIPNRNRYPLVQHINNTMWRLTKKLELSEGQLRVRRASIRVYRDWQTLLDRVTLTLEKRSLAN